METDEGFGSTVEDHAGLVEPAAAAVHDTPTVGPAGGSSFDRHHLLFTSACAILTRACPGGSAPALVSYLASRGLGSPHCVCGAPSQGPVRRKKETALILITVPLYHRILTDLLIFSKCSLKDWRWDGVLLALAGLERSSSRPSGTLCPLANADLACVASKDSCQAKLIRQLPRRQGCGAS